jgi:hypothetical protein
VTHQQKLAMGYLTAAILVTGMTGCAPLLVGFDRQGAAETPTGPAPVPVEAGGHAQPLVFLDLEPAPTAPALPVIWQF